MSKLKHVMFDIETMNNTLRAPIVSIGGVYFDPMSGKIGDELYVLIDMEDALRYRRAGGDTLKWWLKQGEYARAELYNGEGTTTDEALRRTVAFCKKGGPEIRVWGHGDDFDIAILTDAMNQFKITIPWKFWNSRDTRTVQELCEGVIDSRDYKRKGVYHNALDDAKHQVKWLSDMYQRVRESLAAGQKTLV